jgi:hypothetical protein
MTDPCRICSVHGIKSWQPWTAGQYVYVLSIPGGYYKIGRTINIENRVTDLQCAGAAIGAAQ